MKSKTSKFPTLDALIKQGTVWQEGYQYLGRASDGTVVSIGTTNYERNAEYYLAANPTPDLW